MRRFEALTSLGSYRSGRTYTFAKVPQVVLNAVRVGLMREVAMPEAHTAQEIAPIVVDKVLKPTGGRKARKVVDADDISKLTLEILREDDRNSWDL